MLARVRRGASEAVARDPETDTDVVIALDPALSPAENLDRIFRRYRKAVRALAQGGTRREAIAAALESVRASLRELESIAALGEEAAASALEAFSAQERRERSGRQARAGRRRIAASGRMQSASSPAADSPRASRRGATALRVVSRSGSGAATPATIS